MATLESRLEAAASQNVVVGQVVKRVILLESHYFNHMELALPSNMLLVPIQGAIVTRCCATHRKVPYVARPLAHVVQCCQH